MISGRLCTEYPLLPILFVGPVMDRSITARRTSRGLNHHSMVFVWRSVCCFLRLLSASDAFLSFAA